jgi:hypothetical protein
MDEKNTEGVDSPWFAARRGEEEIAMLMVQ